MKASDFKIVCSRGEENVSQMVRQHLAEGWELYGSMASPEAGWFAQAVFKPYDIEPPINAIAYAEGKSIGEITLKVEERLEEGWRPFGGLTIAAIDQGVRYYQMMILSGVKAPENMTNE